MAVGEVDVRLRTTEEGRQAAEVDRDHRRSRPHRGWGWGLAWAGACLAVGPQSVAQAHLGLEYPASRYGAQELKAGPCGRVGGVRTTDQVTVLRPGSVLKVRFDEYVDHPGHYRIAFDEAGDDDFVDPAGFDDIRPAAEYYPNSPILLDGIADRPVTPGVDSVYEVEVTLPDLECDGCTLQVIQVMTDKGPVYGDDDLYYQCADLILSRTLPLTAPPAATPADPTHVHHDDSMASAPAGGGGCQMSPESALGLAGSWPLWLWLACRRLRLRQRRLSQMRA